jgi:hypothetical protein
MPAQKALRERRARNRSIVVDSPRKRAKFESREFPFEIKSEKI